MSVFSSQKVNVVSKKYTVVLELNKKFLDKVYSKSGTAQVVKFVDTKQGIFIRRQSDKKDSLSFGTLK